MDSKEAGYWELFFCVLLLVMAAFGALSLFGIVNKGDYAMTQAIAYTVAQVAAALATAATFIFGIAIPLLRPAASTAYGIAIDKRDDIAGRLAEWVERKGNGK